MLQKYSVKMGNLDQGGVRSTTNWIMLFCVYFRFHWTYSKYFFFNIQFRIFSVYLKKKYKFGLTSLELNWPPQTWSTLHILKFRKHPPPNKKLATWIFFSPFIVCLNSESGGISFFGTFNKSIMPWGYLVVLIHCSRC